MCVSGGRVDVGVSIHVGVNGVCLGGSVSVILGVCVVDVLM